MGIVSWPGVPPSVAGRVRHIAEPGYVALRRASRRYTALRGAGPLRVTTPGKPPLLNRQPADQPTGVTGGALLLWG